MSAVAELVTIRTDGKEIKVPIDLVKLAGLATEAQVQAEKIIVKDDGSAATATDLLSVIKRHRKDADARRKEITDPFREFVERVIGLFKPLLADLEKSEKVVEQKILAFRRERELLRVQEEARRLKEAEKAQVKENKLAAKQDRIPETIAAPLPIVPQENSIKGSIGTASGRKTYRAEIIDPKLVPFDYYLMPDVQEALAKVMNVTARATKGALPVPGVRFYEEEGLAAR